MLCLFISIFLSLWPTPIALVESVQGSVSILVNNHWEPLCAGMSLQTGAMILTGHDGSAVLRLTGSERYEIFPKSVTVLKLNRQSYPRRTKPRTGPMPVIAVRG
jgi:hypothetical protein